MVAQAEVREPAIATDGTAASIGSYADGLRAGVAGALTIAAWFLVLDVLRGQPLHTPTVLGTALFRGVSALEGGTPGVDLELVLSFTWVHLLAFLVIGVGASRLLDVAERDANLGFGVVILFVVFEFGFVLACTLFAEPVLRAVAWPAVLIGNLLAAAAMVAILRRRHPGLTIDP